MLWAVQVTLWVVQVLGIKSNQEDCFNAVGADVVDDVMQAPTWHAMCIISCTINGRPVRPPITPQHHGIINPMRLRPMMSLSAVFAIDDGTEHHM